MAEYNRYYRHFLESMGGGEFEVPELGEIYHYRSPLRGGGGHLFHAHIRQRKGLGFGTYLSSFYQRAKPLLKVLGSQAVNVISGIARDAISGQNIQDATIRNIAKALPPGALPLTLPTSSREGPPALTVLPNTPPQNPSRKRSNRTVPPARFKTSKRRGGKLAALYPGLEYL